ncbi:ribonuclease Y [Candidatus Dojkabacteria bacterium]|nr:ribonuclease Y [Candidatus Dojkabacteria bacterium]
MEVILIITTLAAGAAAYYFYSQSKKVEKVEISEEDAIAKASEKAKKAIEEAEDTAEKIKEKAEETARSIRREVTEQENLLVEREKTLNKRAKLIEKQAEQVEVDKNKVRNAKKILDKGRGKLKTELEKISQMTEDEAKKQLLEELEEDLKDFKARKIREVEKKTEEIADERAKEILVDAMHKIETDYVSETTTTVIKIEDEKIKGRVIGKDGRNIRAFEKATGVDLIIDESPTEIGISCFDPLRREIARVALKKLISDGRIHPGTIEDEIRKAKREIAAEIRKNGQIIAEEAGWPGIDSDLLKLLGKMKYRTSYGQSLMTHTIEVIRLSAALASELGADVELVRKAAALHDVGKLLTHKVEQPHHHISGEIARKYSLPDRMINAIEGHHLDIEPSSIEAWIIHVADAISGARPGARKDSYDQYIKRVEALEDTAKKIGGDKVDDVYAIHAGREVRVLVKPDITDDDEITLLAKQIADEIKRTQTYPGTVTVNVIRELRAQEVAG